MILASLKALPVLAIVCHSSSTLLRHTPFLFTHDAATGYIGKHSVDRPFAETQGLDLVGQLTCGARALDIRVLLDHDGSIRYHHGKGFAWVSAKQTLDNTIPGLVQWGQEHPSELVLLMLSHCHTRKSRIDMEWDDIPCTTPSLIEGFERHGVRVEIDCGKVNSWTLAEAEQHALMDNGGKIMVIPSEGGCLAANYDSSIDSKDKVEPYINRTMTASRSSFQMFSVQAFVQQKFEVPVADSAFLNPEIVRWLTETDLLSGVNLLEVNLICASGILISTALGATVTENDRNTCIHDCVQWCKRYHCSPVDAAGSYLMYD